MFGFYLCAILLLYLDSHTIVADESMSINIYPPSQKVAEHSPAVFTCVTEMPGAQITWYVPQRSMPLNEEKDEVSIRRINDFMSVLRIDEAQIKRHKKTYTCHATINNRVYTTQASLKVLSKQRLHKLFPHIVPIRDGDDVMLPHKDPGTIHMKCESLVTAKKSKPTWRWIKDDFIDLTLDHEDERDDRIELNDDGSLIISRATVNDSGTYMCVAENNRGSAYGTPVTVNVQEGPPIPKLDGCIDDLDVRSKFGEKYNRGGDPCTTCTCIGGVGLRCESMSCIPRPCPPGQRMEMSSEKCCESSCIPDTERPSEVGDIGGAAEFCTDRDGKAIAQGQRYMPEEDPCLRCECDSGRRGRCMMVACDAPRCEHYLSSRDTCCNYTCLPTPPKITESCRDYNGRAVPEGEMYQPDKDPCVKCECTKGQKGMCTSVVCDEPTCFNYRLLPGTCCGFECLGDEIDSVEIDLDGENEEYYPSADPCRTCTCRDGQAPICRSIACYQPPMKCLHGVKRVPGMCCQFECNDGPEAMPASWENAEKVLGRVFIQQIGSDNAFVQWKTSENYEEMTSNLTVFYSKNTDMRDARVIRVGERPYAILRGLDPNSEYHVMVNGTLGDGEALMTSHPVRFSLDGRGRSSFVLSDAIGQVFESRGSIAYTGYSLPRKFESVVRTDDVKIVLNMVSFHRVEISRYNEEPCRDQSCGLLRFYLYTMDGESRNVMSLMFTNEQDFSWAKAHL